VFLCLLTDDPVENPLLAEGHLIEELQRTADLVVGARCHPPLLGQIHQVATDFLTLELIGRLPIVPGQLHHGPDVDHLGSPREIAHLHVFEHALTKGCHGRSSG
jgi:hypothetical protein